MLNIQTLALVVLEKKTFFHCKCMADRRPWGVINLDPRGTVRRIYEGDYKTLLHTKYRSSWTCSFIEDFLFLPL